MAAVTIPYTAVQSAQIVPLARGVHGTLRIPTVVPAELGGPVTVRVPGRGTALYEILVGPQCATDGCYNARVRVFPTRPSDAERNRIQEDLPDGGIGLYHVNEHDAAMLVFYPGHGFRSYLIDCRCDYDQLETIARGLKPVPVY